MKVGVVGSRSFSNYCIVKKLFNKLKNVQVIVSGGARGADSLGERFAEENNIPTKIFSPEWKKHGKRAGFIRNELIIDESDLVVAFWDGVSKDTKHSISLAEKKGIPVIIVVYNQENSLFSNSIDVNVINLSEKPRVDFSECLW